MPLLSRSSKATVSRFVPEILAHLSVGVGIFSDPHGCLEFANDAFARIHGYEPSEILRFNGDDLIPAAKRPEWEAEIAEGIRSGGVFTIEIERARKDGSTFPAVLQLTPLEDGLRILVEVQDRNAQEQIIGGLVEDRSLLMSSFQQLPFPIIALDARTERALVWSDAFLALFPSPVSLTPDVFQKAITAITNALRRARMTGPNTASLQSSTSGLLTAVTLREKTVMDTNGHPIAVLVLIDSIARDTFDSACSHDSQQDSINPTL